MKHSRKTVELGTIFGSWTVLEILPPNGNTKVIAKCVCGTTKQLELAKLNAGQTKSCGCKFTTKTHGLSNSRAYQTWDRIWQRTTNPNSDSWENYGGRGITVCDRWKIFENFLEDMGQPPEDLQLDRIRNNEGYSKENCKWSTRKQNGRNKRNNILVEYQGTIITLSEASELSGISASLLKQRIVKGLEGLELFKTPRKYGL